MYMREREKAPVRKVNVPTEIAPARVRNQNHRIGTVVAARRNQIQKESNASALDRNLLIFLIDTL